MCIILLSQLLRFHQKCKHHYWCNCVRVNADGTQHKWKIKMVLLGSMETLLSSGCSETMLTSEQPLRRLYLSVSLIFLCSPRIVWSLGVVTVFVGHTNGLYERVAEILSFLWVCSICVCASYMLLLRGLLLYCLIARLPSLESSWGSSINIPTMF